MFKTVSNCGSAVSANQTQGQANYDAACDKDQQTQTKSVANSEL